MTSRRKRAYPNQTVELAASIIQSMQEAALVLDDTAKPVIVNAAAEDLFKRSAASVASAESLFEEPSHFQTLFEKTLNDPGSPTIGEMSVPGESSDDPVRFQATLQVLPGRTRKTYIVISLVPVTRETRLLHNAQEMGQRVESLYQALADVRAELLDRTIQLAEQKNKMIAILRGMGDGLLVCDNRGGIIQYNNVAREVLGLPEGELESQSIAELCPELGRLLGLQSDSTEPPILSPHEETFTLGKRELRASIAPVFDTRNRYLGLVMVLQDRTKQAEVERMKSDLISIVSHELRSPLTSIKGYIDLMMSGDLGKVAEGHKKYLEIVSSNANRLAALIDDMLDLSRIESGKLTMSFGKVDVKYLCDFVFLTLKPLAQQKGLDYNLEISDGLAVSGDVDRLQQALTNLVSNAIKYTPEGGAVKVVAHRQNGSVRIDVMDTGFGISPENQKRLFQKFFRVKNKKTRNIGGTGLGLCITQSIVEAHEGAIEVESEEERGSIFSIVLPEYHA